MFVVFGSIGFKTLSTSTPNLIDLSLEDGYIWFFKKKIESNGLKYSK